MGKQSGGYTDADIKKDLVALQKAVSHTHAAPSLFVKGFHQDGKNWSMMKDWRFTFGFDNANKLRMSYNIAQDAKQTVKRCSTITMHGVMAKSKWSDVFRLPNGKCKANQLGLPTRFRFDQKNKRMIMDLDWTNSKNGKPTASYFFNGVKSPKGFVNSAKTKEAPHMVTVDSHKLLFGYIKSKKTWFMGHVHTSGKRTVVRGVFGGKTIADYGNFIGVQRANANNKDQEIFCMYMRPTRGPMKGKVSKWCSKWTMPGLKVHSPTVSAKK